MDTKEIDPNRLVSGKRVDVVVLGARIAPALASGILQRTDIVFKKLHFLPLDAYGRAVRDRLGFPRQAPSPPGHAPAPPDPDTDAAIARWRQAWGSIDLAWLINHQVLGGRGWCHSDGTIALVDELEDYPLGSEVLEDCRRLAGAFPDLRMDVALWSGERTILDYPVMDAPEAPWSPELLASTRSPTIGFLIADGQVEVVLGSNPRLFQQLGLQPWEAPEVALREVRRRQREARVASVHGDLGLGWGVSDGVIEAWRELAVEKGLVDPHG